MQRSAALAFLVSASFAVASCGDRPPQGTAPAAGGGAGGAAVPPKAGFLASRPLQPVGGKVALGTLSPCGPAVERTVRLRNQSAEAVEIKAYASNCACVEAKLVGSRTVGPGEERELQLTVRPSGSGDRSVSVEFGGTTGMIGTVRVDYSLGKGVVALPSMVEVYADEKDRAEDVEVFAGDLKDIRLLRLEPPVGTVSVEAGNRCKASISTFEARRFAEGPEGAGHPGVKRGPDGKVKQLTVELVTDYPECPAARFDIVFVR